MNKELRILVLDDEAADVVLINHELRRCGLAFCCKRVETRREFTRELQQNPPDLIISDHGLPAFQGLEAVTVARNACPEIPFIFVTGSEDEKLPAEMFKMGATDFVHKSRLPELVPAVQQALRLSEERQRREAAEQALQKSEERFRHLVELCPDALWVQSDDRIVFANPAAARLLGAENADRLIGKPVDEIVHPDCRGAMQRYLRQLREEGTTHFWKSAEGEVRRSDRSEPLVPLIQEKLVRLDGRTVEVEVAATPLTFHDRPSLQVIARDITRRKGR